MSLNLSRCETGMFEDYLAPVVPFILILVGPVCIIKAFLRLPAEVSDVKFVMLASMTLALIKSWESGIG